MDVTLPSSLQSITKNKITFGDVNISFSYDLPKENNATHIDLLNQSNQKYNLIFIGPFLYFTKSTIINSSNSISFKMLSNINPSFVIFIPNFMIKSSTRLSLSSKNLKDLKNDFSVTLQTNVRLFSTPPALLAQSTENFNFQKINVNSYSYFIGEIVITFNSPEHLNNFISSFSSSAFNFQNAIQNCPERELCKIGNVNCIGLINKNLTDGRRNNRVYINDNFKVTKPKSCNLVLAHLMDVYSIQIHGVIISNINENNNGEKNEAIACLLDLPVSPTTTVLTFSQFQSDSSQSNITKKENDSNSNSIGSSNSYGFFDQFEAKFIDRFKKKPELSCIFAISDIEIGIEIIFCCEKASDALSWVAVIHSWIMKASSSREISRQKQPSPLQSPTSSPRRKSDFSIVHKRLKFEFTSSSESSQSDEETMTPKKPMKFVQLQKIRSNQIMQKRVVLNNRINNIRKSPQKILMNIKISSDSNDDDDDDDYYSDDDDSNSETIEFKKPVNNNENKKVNVAPNLRNCRSDFDVNYYRNNNINKFVMNRISNHYKMKNNQNDKIILDDRNNKCETEKSNKKDQDNSQFILNKINDHYKAKNDSVNPGFQKSKNNSIDIDSKEENNKIVPSLSNNNNKVSIEKTSDDDYDDNLQNSSDFEAKENVVNDLENSSKSQNIDDKSENSSSTEINIEQKIDSSGQLNSVKQETDFTSIQNDPDESTIKQNNENELTVKNEENFYAKQNNENELSYKKSNFLQTSSSTVTQNTKKQETDFIAKQNNENDLVVKQTTNFSSKQNNENELPNQKTSSIQTPSLSVAQNATKQEKDFNVKQNNSNDLVVSPTTDFASAKQNIIKHVTDFFTKRHKSSESEEVPSKESITMQTQDLSLEQNSFSQSKDLSSKRKIPKAKARSPNKQNDLNNSLNKQNDLNNSLNKQNDLNNSLNKQNDLNNSLNKQNDLNNSLNKQNDLNNSLNKQNDLNNSLNKQNDSNNSPNNYNDSNNSPNKQNDLNSSLNKQSNSNNSPNKQNDQSQLETIEDDPSLIDGESTSFFPSEGFDISFHSFNISNGNKNPQEIQQTFDLMFPYLDGKSDDEANHESTTNSESIERQLSDARKLIESISCSSPTSKLKMAPHPIIVENYIHKNSVNLSIKTLVESFADVRNSTTEKEENEEAFFGSFEVCDERSMDEVISSSLQKLQNSHFNLSDFVKTNDFISFDFDQLVNCSSMKRPIVEEYAYSIQQIVSLANNEHLSIVRRIGVSINEFINKYAKYGNKLTSITITESSESLRLCFLISSLFLNGLKGFNSFGLENEFLDALKMLVVHINSLNEIYELVSVEKTILTQISKFVILLLNSQSLIFVLESILDQEKWVSDFYSSTSYMRDEETLRQIIICHSVVQNMNFDINENTNIIVNISHEDKINFVFRPAYSFMEIDYIESIQNKEMLRNNIVDFFLKELINTSNGKGWQFLCILVDSNHVKLNCEVKLLRESILNAKKNVAASEYDEKKIRAVLSDGLKYGLLHIWFIVMFTNQELTQQFFARDSFFVDLYRANHILDAFADMISDHLL